MQSEWVSECPFANVGDYQPKGRAWAWAWVWVVVAADYYHHCRCRCRLLCLRLICRTVHFLLSFSGCCCCCCWLVTRRERAVLQAFHQQQQQQQDWSEGHLEEAEGEKRHFHTLHLPNGGFRSISDTTRLFLPPVTTSSSSATTTTTFAQMVMVKVKEKVRRLMVVVMQTMAVAAAMDESCTSCSFAFSFAVTFFCFSVFYFLWGSFVLWLIQCVFLCV